MTVLQLQADTRPDRTQALIARFQRWNQWTINLPGTYYLQVVNWLFKENRIAEDRFAALGQCVKLSDVRVPIFIVAGRDDEVVAIDQLLAVRHLVGTPESDIETVIEPCGHLALFLGARSLSNAWRRVAQWLCRDMPAAHAAPEHPPAGDV